MKNIKIQEGIESIDRIKLLMNYSVKNTLTENIKKITITESVMGAPNNGVIDYSSSAQEEEKKIIQIPGYGGKDSALINVVEGTVFTPFQSTDNSGNLFPNRKLINDPKIGWYEVRNNVKVFYPTDKYWQALASIGATKSFTTGPTVSSQGEKYHFVMKLDDTGWYYATIGAKTPQDEPLRGWIPTTWYYKTEGGSEVPYNESTIDIRTSGQKFWDDHSLAIQLVGGLVIGLLTMGIGSLVTAAIIAEAGIVAVEGVILAEQVLTVVNAVNTGRKVAFWTEVVLEGGMNVGIGLYEQSRGQDPALSFIFAALPLLKGLPAFKGVFGPLQFEAKNTEEITAALKIFDGSNPKVFDALSKDSKKLFDEVIKSIKSKPKGFEELITKAQLFKPSPKTILEKTKTLGVSTAKWLGNMTKHVAVEGAVVLTLDLAWHKLYAMYESSYGKPMPQSEIDKVNEKVKEIPSEEEKIKFIEKVAMDYEYSKKITEDPVYVEGVKDEAIRLMGDLTQVNKNVEELSAEMEGWE
jgi:hypothetical protein